MTKKVFWQRQTLRNGGYGMEWMFGDEPVADMSDTVNDLLEKVARLEEAWDHINGLATEYYTAWQLTLEKLGIGKDALFDVLLHCTEEDAHYSSDALLYTCNDCDASAEDDAGRIQHDPECFYAGYWKALDVLEKGLISPSASSPVGSDQSK